ncbi:MAG: Ku protein [Bacteroidota bacterium]|nr:Ku protein [Bacteroidota bacterium]MDP4212040.1 Ku protein [Bacteroidota bacterium]MDP4249607.1 Ku protein [Bacteroidota bacterium]
MRAIWTGAIGFGLVNIPVRIFSATQDSNLDLDMLDKKDHARIRFKRINEETGREVEWSNIVKAYNDNGKYVVVTDVDFEKASPEKSKIIEIMEFVDGADIDSIFYETPYFLEPQKSGVKAYALLREALKKSGKVGLGNFVMRNKEALCILKPMDDVIVLNKIRFAQEIRNVNEINVPGKASIKPGEMQMAQALISQLTGKFDISKYKDSYSDELLKLIHAKSKGKKQAPPQMRVVHNKSKDLMSQLKASLNVKKKKAS